MLGASFTSLTVMVTVTVWLLPITDHSVVSAVSVGVGVWVNGPDCDLVLDPISAINNVTSSGRPRRLAWFGYLR